MKNDDSRILSLIRDNRLNVATKRIRKKRDDLSTADAMVEAGKICERHGDIGYALACFRNCLEQYPGHGMAAALAGRASFRSGNVDHALQFTRYAVETNRADPEIQYIAGDTLRRLQKYDMAIHFLGLAVQLAPDHAGAHSSLGNCHHQKGDLERARTCYELSLQVDPALEQSLLWLSGLHQQSGELEKAVDCLDRALSNNPESVTLLSARANLLNMLGRQQEAFEISDRLVGSDLQVPLTLKVLADLLPDHGDPDRVAGKIRSRLNQTTLSDTDRRMLHYSLGKVLDGSRQYDEAFEHFRAANRLYPQKYDLDSHRRLIDRIVRIYDDEFIERMPVCQESGRRPLFIVGMPRSGTTLLEQILSKHSRINAGGELIYMTEIIRSLGTTATAGDVALESICQMDEKDICSRARSYEGRISTHITDAAHVTDKMPANYLYVGLIHQMYPDASIIHCTRHPMDTCLSVFFQNFGSSHPYSNDLESIAFVYREYQRLMLHWNRIKDLKMIEVSYSDIVKNLEPTITEVLEFCGLAWEPECSEFYNSNRAVATSSFNQVNRPIYEDSLERWRNYETYLEHLQTLLSPVPGPG